MSGETEAAVSAWTVDSLHIHLLDMITEKERQSEERDRRYEQRFESQEKALKAALADRERAIEAALTAHETALQLAITNLRDYYDTLLKERDDRYEQRAVMADKAVVVALATVDKEFHEHLRQVREETTVALAAAEKAIDKAEIATEKRFESVNEFRAQQADIITTFARKAEVEARLSGLAEKVELTTAQILQLAGSTLPRNEYDRAHVDLADKVTGGDKALNEKLETQAKAFDARIALLQAQVSSVEAVTR